MYDCFGIMFKVHIAHGNTQMMLVSISLWHPSCSSLQYQKRLTDELSFMSQCRTQLCVSPISIGLEKLR